MAVGIEQRHGRKCKGGRCVCPWQGEVYSKKDKKKIRKLFATKAEAQSWRDDAKGAVRKRVLRAPTSTTLSEATAAWLKGARAGVIRPRGGEVYKPATLRGFERALRLRVLPELGNRRLCDIEREDLQQFVDELIAAGASPALIEATIIPIRSIYRHVIRSPSSGIVVNPTVGLELPATRGQRDRIAPPSECLELLAPLPAQDTALWATAMYAGLRRGELQALRVRDIDLQVGVIDVRRGWDQYEGEIDTKSRKPRKVPIPGALRVHVAKHLLALPWSDGLVFGVTKADPFVATSLAYRSKRAWGWAQVANPALEDDPEAKPATVWIKAQEDPLTPITLHECRHTYASLMIAAGVNAKALSTYMGHANISITMDRYGHLFPGNEDEAAGLLDTYLESAVQ
jgi:integrase